MSDIDPVYANKETRIYHSKVRKDACRESEILKKNRAYFANPDEAEENDYSPCKKCYPQSAE